MTHLRDAEFIDFAEGTLPAGRAAHLDSCAACREQAEALASTLRDVSAIEVPEPSPLFWDHFSARVRGAVADQTPAPAPWWSVAGVRVLMPLAATLALVIAIVSAAFLPRMLRSVPSGSTTAVPAGASADSGSRSAGGDVAADADDQNATAWAVLTAAASDMAIDDAPDAGMGVRPGAVDHAVTHMNQAELTELGRLLQTELKRSGN